MFVTDFLFLNHSLHRLIQDLYSLTKNLPQQADF